jgi:hypothetical protein
MAASVRAALLGQSLMVTQSTLEPSPIMLIGRSHNRALRIQLRIVLIRVGERVLQRIRAHG